MPDFSWIKGSNRSEGAADASNSRGINIIPDAAANTKGTWYELFASTSFRAYGLSVQFMAYDNAEFLFDIAVGPTSSEVIILENVLFTCRKTGVNAFEMIFPITVPEGSKLSARVQSAGTSDVQEWMTVQLISAPFLMGVALGRATTYGADVSDSGGVTIDPGSTANTKGVWFPIGTLDNKMRAFSLHIGSNNNAALAAARFLIDVGIGSGGSEIVLLPDLGMQTNITSDSWYPAQFGPFPVNIPAGTRLSVRAQSSTTSSVDRLFDVAIIGYD